MGAPDSFFEKWLNSRPFPLLWRASQTFKEETAAYNLSGHVRRQRFWPLNRPGATASVCVKVLKTPKIAVLSFWGALGQYGAYYSLLLA